VKTRRREEAGQDDKRFILFLFIRSAARGDGGLGPFAWPAGRIDDGEEEGEEAAHLYTV
jgi:hypothetical protein